GGALVARLRRPHAAEPPVAAPLAALALVEPVDDPAVAALVRAVRQPRPLAEQPERGRERALAAAPVGRGAAARDVEEVRGDGGAPVERTQQRDELLRPRQVRE